MIKLKAAELRTTTVSEEDKTQIVKNPVYIILDNVLDTYNIGAIFRLADAVSATKVYLCGETETPPHTRIKKASINTTEWVDWEYAKTAVEAIEKVRSSHFAKVSRDKQNSKVKIIAIEQDKRSVKYDTVDYTFPVALVVGHETHGVSQETLAVCDTIVELPMWGVNVSLNVMVSLGIVLYKAMEQKS